MCAPKYFQLLGTALKGETGGEGSALSGAVRCWWFLSAVTGKDYQGQGILRPIFIFRLSLTNDSFSRKSPWRRIFLQVTLPEIPYQQKVKWESVCKDKLKRDYMYTDRGVKKIKSSKISASGARMTMLWKITRENFESHQIFLRMLEWKRKQE